MSGWKRAFLRVSEFAAATSGQSGDPVSRIVHTVNPFPAPVGSDHDRAQRVTFASMTRAQQAADILAPGLTVDFAAVTLEEAVETPGIQFDRHHRLKRDIGDLKRFKKPRRLPLAFDILSAPVVEAGDLFVFTNVDIALAPGFYGFLAALFAHGADAAVINRRTISGGYTGPDDLALMDAEIGEPHPGFDCFAFRGSFRDRLIPYESCVGIGGVMLPLVHMILAMAERPVILTDAHQTFHLGDDRTWETSAFADYQAHNWAETDRVFAELTRDPVRRDRLLARLEHRHADWVYPRRLREHTPPPPPPGLLTRARRALHLS